MEKKFNRKKFLKITGLSVMAVFILGIIKAFKDDIFNIIKSPSSDLVQSVKQGTVTVDNKKTAVVLSAVNRTIEEAVVSAAQSATDFSWLKKRQTVFIKPVVNSGNRYPATTHPRAIAAMITLLRQKGAGRVIVGDMSGIEHLRFYENETSGSTKKLMMQSGILQAVLNAGGEPRFFEQGGWNDFYRDPVDSKDYFKNGLMMPNILKEVDHIVLMPRCSRHILAGSSLGLKAAVGYWRTDSRLEYHENGNILHELTAAGNRSRTLLDKQRLVISTGDRILATLGPDNGYVYEPGQGIVIASESVIAHDMVSLAWLLFNRKLLPEDKKNLFGDHSRGLAKTVNKFVVYLLSRSTLKGFTSKSLFKNDLKTIWDDRVLNEAYKSFDGMPKIELTQRDGVDKKILAELQRMVAFKQS
ncbi:MAG: DUF362 domain-containing protein [Spirochaetes bacterium]|nr:DUF362 domain-containing protein [Spirochaetota bacterium]